MSEMVMYSQLLANIAVIAGAVIAVLQLIRMRKSNELQEKSITAGHERRKKQATIEFYNSINKESGPLMQEIRQKCGKNAIPLSQLADDPDLREKIKRYLSLMERFSVGIHTNVYDLNVYDMMRGTVTIQSYHQLHDYIDQRRKETLIPALYVEFEELTRKLEEMRKNKEAATRRESVSLRT